MEVTRILEGLNVKRRTESSIKLFKTKKSHIQYNNWLLFGRYLVRVSPERVLVSVTRRLLPVSWNQFQDCALWQHIDEMRDERKIFIGTSEGERPFAGSRRRWEHNIEMDLKAIKREMWTGIKRFRRWSSFGLCEHYSESLGSIEREFVTSSTIVTFSGSPLSKIIQFSVEPGLFWTSALGLMV